MKRFCTTCKIEKELDQFTVDARRRGGHSTICKACYRIYSRARRHGITVDDVSKILEAQGYRCKLCLRPLGKHWHIDHDHNCCGPADRGKACGRCIRGILCASCNVGIAHFGDSAEMLDRAASYVRRGTMSTEAFQKNS